MDRKSKLALITKYLYPKSQKNLWFSILSKHCHPEKTLLEIGSGSGKWPQNSLYPRPNTINTLIGLDPDERILTNPYLNKAIVGSAYYLSNLAESKKFDIIYSHMVAEHIEDPKAFLSEQLKSLRPDGIIIHSTVSKYYWSSFLNRLLPEPLKDFLILHLGSGRPSSDTFPAYYCLNSEDDIARLAKNLKFSYQILRQDEPPGYLQRSFLLMILYSLLHKPLQAVLPALRPTFILLITKKT